MIDLIQAACERHGYPWTPAKAVSRPYDLFVFGVRNADRVVDAWDDLIGCIHAVPAAGATPVVVHHLWRGTTDPGRGPLVTPMNRAGCAAMVPGQYRCSHRLGPHKGTPALVQAAPVRVYRDGDRDAVLDLDPTTIEAGMYGINIHGPYREGLPVVGPASAGCQVFGSSSDLAALLDLVKRQAAHGMGDRVTYTLFDAREDPDIGRLLVG